MIQSGGVRRALGLGEFRAWQLLVVTLALASSLTGPRLRSTSRLRFDLPTAATAKPLVRESPMSDKISAQRFHHVEYYCGDARTTASRFMFGLGMELCAKSDQSTGNSVHASYVVQSGDVRMLFTAPYGLGTSREFPGKSSSPFPGFDPSAVQQFHSKHGLAVKAVAIEVSDVQASFDAMIQNGGVSVTPPCEMRDELPLLLLQSDTTTPPPTTGVVKFAELTLYGDVILRLVDTSKYSGSFLPNFQSVCEGNLAKLQGRRGSNNFGLTRFDHIVGNLWSLEPTLARLKAMTGFHDFAEFVAEDVGTVDSGLNSVVLANNNEFILLPLNEPTFGTRRKSQIQTYLEQNGGEGVQHIALSTNDIFYTMENMRSASPNGGFEFMERPSADYYVNLRRRLGASLSHEQYTKIEELGLLADKDDQGVLLQVFTKPVGDRATLFLEIIQRVGCIMPADPMKGIAKEWQKPGCGGFGKGNFKDLFKSIEDYEATLKGI